MEDSNPQLLSKQIVTKSKSCKKSNQRYLINFPSEKPPVITSKSITDPRIDWMNITEKQQLSDQLKNQKKEIIFLQSILNQFIEAPFIGKIKEKSQHDPLTNSWTLPSFLVQQKKLIFPTMKKSQFKELVNKEINKKKVVLQEEELPDKKQERPLSTLPNRRCKKQSIRDEIKGKFVCN